MRLLALMLVVFLTTSPLAGAWSIPEGAPEPCLMAATMQGDLPCFTAPCPCDHSSQAIAVSPAGPTVLPRTHVCAAPLATTRPCVAPAIASPARGFPFAIDRPPTTRA